MKKFLSVLLAAVMVISGMAFAFAQTASAADVNTKLQFNEDGNFKIMMINDTQDVGDGNKEQTVNFITKALAQEKPDLVVFDGDQLADIYPGASAADYKIAIDKVIKPVQDAGVPFLVTLGNHDHDRADKMSEAEQYKVYASYDNCISVNVRGDSDPFTCNTLVYDSYGEDVVFNIYVMDSNNKANGSYTGINASQLAWYNETSAALKEANDGEVVPSLLFQHVPVKEVYKLFKECDWNTDGAIYSRRDSKWYVLDENKATGHLGEAPCSENFDIQTGEYQAWVANGDIMGAFFAHDHLNCFSGTTEDGITMTYNGGTGFRAYGDAENGRSIRIIELNEYDVTEYTTHVIYYQDVVGETSSNFFFDTFSPAILNKVMKVVYAMFGWLIKLFK